MTTQSSDQGARDNFDAGPLSWVMGEIREALTRSKSTLQEAVALDSDAKLTSLRHAKAYLHQAHGALQIVDIDGIPVITEAVEDVIGRMESGTLELDADAAESIADSYQALIEYLEELLAGEPHQPVRLFPYYQVLMKMRGVDRVHPSDLFFPNLGIRPQLPVPAAPVAVDYAKLRRSFEKALLPFLKSADRKTEQASLAVMEKLIGEIESAQTNQQLRAFWWVMHGFADTVSAGKVYNELYAKQLYARINLQIRRLSEGSISISERVLRDALFFIASASRDLPHRPQQVRSAYRLNGMVPEDYDQKRYAQINAEQLAAAKEQLSQAKNMWNRLAERDLAAAPLFEQEMNKLAEAGAYLNSPSLSKLLRELSGIARHAAHSNPGESLGLEIATSLLFVENALNHPSRLSDDFAERADAMTARLLAIVAGEAPAQSAHWLDEMSHKAQQKQTMGVLATEMQASLSQVEKMLDEYFGNPAKRVLLENIDSVLHQIEGAMAILDQDDAKQAVEYVRAEIKKFADCAEGGLPEQAVLQNVAQNIGALSFFIETIQLNSTGIKKRFVFDSKLGIFHANLIEGSDGGDNPVIQIEAAGEGAVPSGNVVLGVSPEAPSLPTVEAELAQHQQESAALAISLTEQPDNSQIQEQLKESLIRVRSDAALVEDSDATTRAQTAIDILENPDFLPTAESLAEIVSATAPAQPAVQATPAIQNAPVSDEAIDAELLEIFLGEAREVLDCIVQTLPMLRHDPQNLDHMTTLRRCFHTLKGSGRMVGLAAFGEAAWSVEQVLNLRLSDMQGGSLELYALIEKATEVLGSWVTDLVDTGRSSRSPAPLVAAAGLVKQGAPFAYQEIAAEPVQATPSSQEPAAEDSLPSIEGMAVEIDAYPVPAEDQPAGPNPFAAESGLDISLEFEDSAFVPNDPEPGTHIPASGRVIDFPEAQPAKTRQDDNVKRIGSLEISLPLHNIYLAETDELVRLLGTDFSEWRHEPGRDVNIVAVHAAHSLAGSSATVGLDSLHQVAHGLEMVLQSLARKPVRLQSEELDTLEQSVECLKQMLQRFALDEMPDPAPDQVKRLQALRQSLASRSGMDPNAVHSSVPELGPAEEAIQAAPPPAEFPQDRRKPAEPLISKPEPSLGNFSVEVPVIKTSSASAKPVAEPDQAKEQEDNTVVIKDDLDADLLPVFLEEGQDILPQMESALRTWQLSPADTSQAPALLRHLHTVKGSARMAGAMELGQHMHLMETRIEQLMRLGVPSAELLEDLLSRFDIGLYMFDQLRDPDPNRPVPAGYGVKSASENAKPANAESTAAVPALRSERAMPAVADAGQLPGQPAAPVHQVRVRADVLDRLVNQAGEVSISRSKIETEIDTLRGSLSEMTENVSRLRTQLREIEIQAESQMASQMAHAVDREFDPLEFDRFTRLQELTRGMAESVNDVASVQQNLLRTIDGATIDLTNQARLTRDLQQDLMRVRMVQFASISERLYRVTRQASKEVDKRVHLDIRGGNVEIDRSVLERMAGPFEHLLRNSIAHGIESRETRVAAGKNEIGELTVEIRQEGNEVVMQFSDDGAGLNLDRIREKATSNGLLAKGAQVSDAELQDMIFHPGFSTASEVTELAGRGIGMDVVRAEAAALGGRIAIESERGKGARFMIRLPLTLAVTQVVLLSSGGKIYAVPSVLVEQVRQLKANALAAMYNDGGVFWQSAKVPIFYLSTLLGDTAAAPLSQQYSPVVLLRSGNERVAIHVDQIIGNREVVVKNIGPQLARMLGIAGATVLGSGDIVLILNPAQLAHSALHQELLRAPRITPSDAPDDMGAVADVEMTETDVPDSAPVQGLRTQQIVMVVDDSLTVRRVTQRLLSREGYQVVLAKDGVDALEQLQAITPSVMLVDIEMPRMDGFDLTRNVRDDERTRNIPIIMITSRTATKHRNYALELGVNEYLGKPFQEEELLRHVASYASKSVPVA